MKTKHIRKAKRPVNTTQTTVLRTKSVRKRLPGRQPKRPSTATRPAVDPTLKLSLEFGEATLSTAIMLSDRLNQVSGDSSTRLIRETLKVAQANFEALCARVSGFQQRVGL